MARFSLSRACLLLTCFLAVVSGKDFYQLLGLQRGASEQQMKKAYRKLALQYHPDKLTGTAAEKEAGAKLFADINHAYEVLSDAKKRQIYDRYGEEGLKQHGDQGGHDAGDIFSHFFGGGGFGGFGGEEEAPTPRGDDVTVTLQVTLRDVYVGRHLEFSRTKATYRPAPGKRQCNCRAKMVTHQVGPGMFQQYQKQVCEECANVKLVRETVQLSVDVEPGMPHGHVITVFEEGEADADGDPGDLNLQLHLLPHPRFRREGRDLHLTASITLLEALTGFSHEVEHLDGHKVKLERTAVTIPGQVVRIPEQGMPVYGDELRKGDLVVAFTVDFPQQVTEQQKQALRKLLV